MEYHSAGRLSKFWIQLIILLLGSVLISACGIANVDLTVYADDTYSMIVQISIPTEIIGYYGNAEEFEAELNRGIQQATEDGAKVSWRKINSDDGSSVTYEIRIDNASLTDQGDFNWKEVQYNGKTAYRFDMSEGGYSGFQSISITLHAKKILSTNGTKINSSTVQWINPNAALYAVVIPKSRFNWIPFVIALALFILLCAITFVAFITGKLKGWIIAGFSTSKWRMQSIKVNTDQSRLQREKDKGINELGKIAWEARVNHPNYVDIFDQLETIEAQRSANQANIKEQEGELHKLQQTRSEINADYNNRITELQSNRKEVSGKLNQALADKAGFERRLSKAQKDIEQYKGEIDTLQKRIETLRSSSAPEDAEQVNTLTNAIGALERSFNQNTSDIPNFQSELSRLTGEASLLDGEVKALDQKISAVRDELKNSLSPVDQQIKELQEKILNISDENARLAREMAPLIEKLGPKVFQTRPDAPALAEKYSQLDKLDSSLTDVTQQNSLLKARISTTDPKSVRNFFIFLTSMAILLIIILVLAVLAFV
jgi:predicted  nucleic acid-binding Zn-ribbon protein